MRAILSAQRAANAGYAVTVPLLWRLLHRFGAGWRSWRGKLGGTY
jgi:hypothetical protein